MTLMLSRKDVSAHKIAPSNDANQEGQMFAVTRITGQVGGVVARILLAAGLEVRGVVRDPVKGEDWANQGCEVAIAEMNDAVALARAFDGAEAVFILLPLNFDPAPGFPEARTTIAAVSDALAVSMPKRVVCLSTSGAQATQPSLLQQSGMMERIFGLLPMPVACLRADLYLRTTAMKFYLGKVVSRRWFFRHERMRVGSSRTWSGGCTKLLGGTSNSPAVSMTNCHFKNDINAIEPSVSCAHNKPCPRFESVSKRS
jgi:hypothetical protein